MPGWRHHSCHEEALARVEGADKLVGLYGYWPSFHDARIEAITVDTAEPSVTVRFLTSDRAAVDSGEDPNKLAQVTMRWGEVSELTLGARDWVGEDVLWELALSVSEAGIRTDLRPNGGLAGSIVAGSVEVLEVRPVGDSSSCR
jgi:hypothetical protein